MKRRLMMLAGAALIAGCAATGGGSRDNAAAGRNSVDALEGANIDLSDDNSLTPLANAALPEKSCGMILWTLEARRPAPVFRFIVGEAAEISVDERPVALVRTDYDGPSAYGVFENQEFRSPEGLMVSVDARLGAGFDGGAYLERALIKVKAADGWSIIAPAAGIAGCRGAGG
ncbi:MAG: hypothetical protein AAGA09_08080 [Pseudomonadota bacterium]